MTLPVKRGQGDHQPMRDGRARITFGSGRRQFVHVWTAPRSPAARLVVIPLLLLATLLILALGLLALLAFVAVAFVIAFLVLLVGRPLAAIKGRSSAPARRPPSP